MSSPKDRGARRGRPAHRRLFGGRATRRDLVIGITILTIVIGGALSAIVFGLVAFGPRHQQSASSTPTSAAPSTTAFGPITTTSLTPDQATASAWETTISKDFSPLESVLQPLLQEEQSWETGQATAAAVASEIATYWPDFEETSHALAKQAPLPLAPQALDDYRQSVNLYAESTRLLQAATSLAAGPLTKQLQLSSTRIRELGDRVFDQATVVLTPLSPPSPNNPDVTIVHPPDVPLWASIGLAPGPPLAPTAVNVAPVTYETTRPQESFARWQAQVEQAGIPTAAAETAAIQAGSTADLGQQSAAFGQASITLSADPDPTDGRIAGTRLRLGLLVDAESTRVAEAASLLDSAAQAQLRPISEALAAVGDDLWDPQVGARSTGFPLPS